MVLGKSDTSCKSMTLEHSLTPYAKINSKWFEDLNIRHDNIKILGQNTGKTFLDINHSNLFLGQSAKTKENKAQINKQNLIKFKVQIQTEPNQNQIQTEPNQNQNAVFAQQGSHRQNGMKENIYK